MELVWNYFKKKMKCEVCGNWAGELINIGLDVGYHLGDYGSKGKGDYEKFRVKPVCIGVTSIYLCYDCKSKIEKHIYFNVNIIDKLKKLIKKNFIKNMILENLK